MTTSSVTRAEINPTIGPNKNPETFTKMPSKEMRTGGNITMGTKLLITINIAAEVADKREI